MSSGFRGDFFDYVLPSSLGCGPSLEVQAVRVWGVHGL